MLSLSSFDEQPDIEHTLNIIRNGGRKAKGTIHLHTHIIKTNYLTAWLKDKIEGSKFALPALYFPRSLIPPDIWKACPTTTNGNKQAHCNINQDGTNLTLLGGIMRGQEYDARAATSIDIHCTYGIHNHDKAATYTHRVSRSVSRHGKPISTYKKKELTPCQCLHSSGRHQL